MRGVNRVTTDCFLSALLVVYSYMDLFILIGIGIVGVLLIILIVRVSQKPKETESALLLQQQLEALRKTLDEKLSESSKVASDAMQKQLNESGRMIRDVTQGLTKLQETNKQVITFTDQLQQLQDILQNPKRRGVLGEYYLETVLENVLPPAVYKMQYQLGKGEGGKALIVDAVIFVQDKIIPIDSKFSLENYNRLLEAHDSESKERIEKEFRQDLKNRIDETSKYIQPQKKTMDFALMFIPSEAIFYDLLINRVGAVQSTSDDLISYAAKKKVNIVSPNSFYAFLQVILQGLKQVEVEKSAVDILKNVDKLGGHLQKYDHFMLSLGKSLGTSVNHYNKASKEFKKIDKDMVKLTGSALNIEEELLESPDVEKE
jgi:DNA recombination protein RmuC